MRVKLRVKPCRDGILNEFHQQALKSFIPIQERQEMLHIDRIKRLAYICDGNFMVIP